MASLASHEILPFHHPPPTRQSQLRHLTTPLFFFLHLHTSKPLATLALIYALSISGPSAPQFDILTLHETSRGCFILGTSLSTTQIAELTPKALSMIPVALTFLIVISEKLMVCIVSAVVYGVPVLRRGMEGVFRGVLGAWAEVTRRLGYIP
ncbi:hypothetical protein BPOR_0218g00020 [Botrytis porri]|uniref:Uncharacterized protein n=1 Tax=Botrytis porri TaxID=87229 RepID=A0A4Z1KPX0_9HELO|nr:hypothetical protein BPOR_0218g00020 [Botrytis porri]